MGDAMSFKSKQEYLKRLRSRYRRASREDKGRMLDEACAMLAKHRKSVIRSLASEPSKGPRPAGRPPRYGPEVREVLMAVWKAADMPCSKRMVGVLPVWLPHYERHHGALDPEVRDKVLAMSPATIGRQLAGERARQAKRRAAKPTPESLKSQIPVRPHFSGIDEPGWLEIDTVAHGGQTTAGQFIWTLSVTDIHSGWTESRAVWSKQSRQIVARLREIEKGLPFDLLGLDTDNGTEFMNRHMHRFTQERPEPLVVTRSRPYRKNDNAHIEQRQFTHVRQLLGYDRLEDKKLLGRLNALYSGPWRDLQNFFMPSMRLVGKDRVGSKIVRHHSQARTPCERLLASASLDETQQAELRRCYEGLDPFALADQVQEQLKGIFRQLRAYNKRHGVRGPGNPQGKPPRRSPATARHKSPLPSPPKGGSTSLTQAKNQTPCERSSHQSDLESSGADRLPGPRAKARRGPKPPLHQTNYADPKNTPKTPNAR